MGDIRKDAGTSDKASEAMEVDCTETPKMESKVKADQSDNGKSGDESLKDGNDTKVLPNKVNAKKRTVSERKSEDSASEESITEVKEGLSKGPRATEKEDSSAESDMNLPTFDESLGKGKRARIPNKRYSDILLSPSRPQKQSNFSIENGDQIKNDKIDSENDDEVSNIATAASVKSRLSTNSPVTKKKPPTTFRPSSQPKVTANPSDPRYLKPFELGWKRELVYRAGTINSSSENLGKRAGDIYYYTPSGKKIRSMREITENLKNSELTLNNFLFLREPVGINDPEKEIIRDAKIATKMGSTKKVAGKVGSKTGDDNSGSTKPKTPAKSSGNIKIKLPPSRINNKGEKKNKVEDDVAAAEVNNSRRSGVNKKALAKVNNVEMENKPCQPCSIRCQGVMGMVPTLQCRLCLCLYHYECVGLSSHIQITSYVCKNCQLEHGQTVATPASIVLPPLTPINPLKTFSTQSAVLPRVTCPLNESPHHDSSVPIMPRLVQMPKIGKDAPPTTQPVKTIESKSIVGSVTSWLPHSSTIQVEQKNKGNQPVEAPRPQYLEYLAGRKFLIIPKHNVVSISPTVRNKFHQKALNNLLENIGEEGKDTANNNQEVLAPDDQKLLEFNNYRNAGPKRRMAVAASKTMDGEDSNFMECYLQNLCLGYKTLLHIFQYLKVQDLLRAGCVCTMWRDIANHPSLWRTVRMKNSQVYSFQGFSETLKKHGTIHLDLRKMLLFPHETKEIWSEFSEAIKNVQTLRKIEFCRCPASVIENIAASNPNLEFINALAIRGEHLSLVSLSSLKNLKELRLKSPSGLILTSGIQSLTKLEKIKHLSLTSVKDLYKQDLTVIAALVNLESLDIGECVDFPENFGTNVLSRLTKLEKLRLEKGQGTCHTFEMLGSIGAMAQLEQLELVNFDIKPGFDIALGGCANIKKLLIIPTYISQSATTNHMVLGGVARLQASLTHFVWGVTLELLRVTELFVDQSEDAEKKKEKKLAGGGDSIPVLKPVPLSSENDDIPSAHEPPQVEIIPLTNLQKLLFQSLSNTKVKILKIPFHATWRQSLIDTINN